MKTTKLLFTALALVGVVACQKTEIPAVQEEQEEVIAPEESQGAQPQQTMDIKSVGRILNEVAETEEVQSALPDIMVEINLAKIPWHLEFNIAKADEEQASYVKGTLGLTKGLYHLVVLDLDLMVMDMVPVVGTIDIPQISKYLLFAAMEDDNAICDEYLELATAGLDISIFGMYRLAFLRGEDMEDHRTIDLYLCDPSNPDSVPFPLSMLLKMFQAI